VKRAADRRSKGLRNCNWGAAVRSARAPAAEPAPSALTVRVTGPSALPAAASAASSSASSSPPRFSSSASAVRAGPPAREVL
jgi:hypothetical protein